MKKLLLFSLLICACLPYSIDDGVRLTQPTQAIVYVNAGGSIQKAINAAPNNTTIIVTEGTYNERPIIPSTKSGLVLKAQGKVITKGFHVAGNFITVDGFEITATSSTYIDGFGIWVKGNNCVIQNNYIHDTAWGGILTLYYTSGCTIRNNRIGGNVSQNGIDVRGTGHIVENNEIWDIRQMSKYLPTPLSYADADGIHFHGSNLILKGNYIHDIPYGGDNVNTHTDCFQTFDGLTEQPKAVNVLIDSNRCENIGAVTNEILTKGLQVQSAQGLTVTNNIFCAAVGMRLDGASGLVIENNDLCGDLSLPANIVSDCIQFANASGELNRNYCRNFSGWALRADGANTIKGAGNAAINTQIRAGTEYLFALTPTPTKVPTQTVQTPTVTATQTATPTVQVPQSPTPECHWFVTIGRNICVQPQKGYEYVGKP